MAYRRGQHNVPYVGGPPQRGYRLPGNLPAVRPKVKQFSASHSWEPTVDHAASTSWENYEERQHDYDSAEAEPQEGYEAADYVSGYTEGGYEPVEAAGYREVHGSLWQGRGGVAGRRWQGARRGGVERQWLQEGRDNSGTEWQGKVEDDSGLDWEGQERSSLRDNVNTYRPSQGRGKRGVLKLDQGREDTGLHLRGEEMEGTGTHWRGIKREDTGAHWRGEEREDSGTHRRGKEMEDTGTHWRGIKREDTGAHWRGEEREDSGTHRRGKEMEDTGTHWRGIKREDTGTHWRGEGRENSGLQWQDEKEENDRTQLLDPVVGDSGSYRQSQGREDSGFQWQDAGEEQEGTQWLDQGVDVIGPHWQGKDRVGFRRQAGRGHSDSQWHSQGEDNLGTQWPDQGRRQGGIRGRGRERGHNAHRNVDIRGMPGQRGGFVRDYGGGVGRDVNIARSGGRGLDRGGGSRGRPFESSFLAADDSAADQETLVANEEEYPQSEFASLMAKWQAFYKKFADCGNAISNVECSLKASKLHALSLSFDCKFLAKCGNSSVFTSVLHVKKRSEEKGVPEESLFLARCQGLSKKSSKLYCYEEAYRVLQNSSVEEIMKRQDVSEKDLKQEIQRNYTTDPDKYLELLKGGTASTLSSGASQQSQDVKKEPENETESENKRSSSGSSTGPAAKKSRKTDFTAELAGNKHLSLAPTRKLEVLMSPDDPLEEKLQMLKQLLKEEGITKLHIVPKMDQLAYKSAIHIHNVYRLEDVAEVGFETPVYCEIYFDDVYMIRGPPDVVKQVATEQAYSYLARKLCSQPLDLIANNPRIWTPYMVIDVDVQQVVTKWHGKDNDSILTNNLTNMKQMMQSKPDLTIPIQKFVVTEHESDKVHEENLFKFLELSATRNLMLLECEIMRNPDLTFTCTLSMQGKILATRSHTSKIEAKQLCSKIVMKWMRMTQNIIYVESKMVGRTITKSELLLSAMKKKAVGEPPAKIFRKAPGHREDELEEFGKLDEKERLPENITVRPLFPWLAAAMYEILDEYYQKITLEDLMLELKDTPKSQREVIVSCATKMGFRLAKRPNCDGPVLTHTVTAQDMDKILQLHGGESGRYKLVSCKKPLSEEELEEFRNQWLEQHRKLVEARTNDIPEVYPEIVPETESQLDHKDSFEKTFPAAVRPHQARETSTGSSSLEVTLPHKVPPPPQFSAFRPRFEPRIPPPLPPWGFPPRPFFRPGFPPVRNPYLFRGHSFSGY